MPGLKDRRLSYCIFVHSARGTCEDYFLKRAGLGGSQAEGTSFIFPFYSVSMINGGKIEFTQN